MWRRVAPYGKAPKEAQAKMEAELNAAKKKAQEEEVAKKKAEAEEDAAKKKAEKNAAEIKAYRFKRRLIMQRADEEGPQ